MAATNKYSLAGKSAVVTGAGNGIGRAIALAFAEAGAPVACVDLDASAAEATASAVAKCGAEAFSVRCDVGSEADVEAATKAILGKFPAIHILVNGAAGYDPNGTVLDLTLSDWNRVFAVNVGGAFLMSRAILPAMIAAGGGSIIHIASQLGSVAAPRRAVYCATKGALIQLAKAMATDHAAQKSASIHYRQARSRPSGWSSVLATWKRRVACPARNIFCKGSASQRKLRSPQCFWQAMLQAS